MDRILVAEDHEVSRHLLKRNLMNWGFAVITAANGEQALAILEAEEAPPLAIIDWMMPGIDGVEVCRRVRNTKCPYIYLVLLTAKGEREDITEGLNAGADDYVVKPFDPSELRARLKVGQRVVHLERMLARKVHALERALHDVKQLRRLLPICMYCKRIRDDKDYWQQIEDYIHSETGASFSHGICPSCLAKIQAGGDPKI